MNRCLVAQVAARSGRQLLHLKILDIENKICELEAKKDLRYTRSTNHSEMAQPGYKQTSQDINEDKPCSILGK